MAIKNYIKFLLLACLCCSCANPPTANTALSSIPPKEINAIKYASEGIRLLKKSRLINALFNFEKAHWLQPSALNIQFNIAYIKTQLGLLDEAQNTLLILEKNFTKEKIAILKLLAKIQIKKNNPEKATRYLQQIIDILTREENLSQAAQTYNELGSYQLLLGKESEALCNFKNAYFLDPQKEYLRNIVTTLTNMGFYKEAIHTLKIERVINNAKFIDLGIILYITIDQWQEAEKISKHLKTYKTQDLLTSALSEIILIRNTILYASKNSNNEDILVKNKIKKHFNILKHIMLSGLQDNYIALLPPAVKEKLIKIKDLMQNSPSSFNYSQIKETFLHL